MVNEARDLYDAVFSPDGQWLLYRTDDNAPGNGDIYARRLSGDTTSIPIAVTPAEETSPDVSPDGNWIAYAERVGDRKEVVVRSFPDPSRSRTQVSSGGGTEPRWSPDGRTLIYRKSGGTFASVTIATDGAFRVVREALIGGDGADYLRNNDARQWDLMPNGRELLVARLVKGARTRRRHFVGFMRNGRSRPPGGGDDHDCGPAARRHRGHSGAVGSWLSAGRHDRRDPGASPALSRPSPDRGAIVLQRAAREAPLGRIGPRVLPLAAARIRVHR
jgi:dipeptidyl aminopeptidase/acylaminoacyl peptidase